MTGEPPRQDRSDEEREAARLERERARAERAAKQAAREAGKPPRGRDAGDPRAAKPRRDPRVPGFLRGRRDGPGGEAGAEPPRAEPPRAEPPARADRAEPPRAEPDRAAPRAAAPPSAVPDRAEGGAPSARPAVHRPSVRERTDALLASRRGGKPPGGGAPGQRSGRFRRGRIVALVTLLLLAAGALWIVLALFQPGKGDGEGMVAITIPRGAGVSDIGDLLADRGVVDSAFLFEVRTRLAGKSGDLKPGIFNLKRDMSYGAAIDALSTGPAPDLINVTIPEGSARREIAGQIEQAGVRGSYVRASARSRELNPRRYGAARAKDLEGFLFPATYQLRKGSTARQLVQKQLQAFEQNWSKVNLRAARRANLTPYDVLIIASLVEREAQLDKERPLVASVIYNRLRVGMNLGIDATTRYAVNNWTGPLRQSELRSSSPYNTRNHAGLPPGPIGNPGLESMRAAARPKRTKFLFYVVKPGTCGEHSFAATDAEHQRNVAAYDRARRAAGGKSPTTC
ncbi:MAG TPA: endolytic transglycosylase MltG [Thermoleophilaceae bacterium]